MTTTAAQDEFNELLRDKDIDHRHPEDRHDDSDLSDPESEGHADEYREIIDTDDELEIPVEMRSNNFHMPSLRSEANTGPKGVIADAQAFERDRKQQNRNSTWKSKPKSYSDDKASSDEDAEESFLRAWRARRVQELQNAGQRMRSRTISPSRRIYGTMPEADGDGYLDAVEKTVPNTVVVVLLCSRSYVQRYDPKNEINWDEDERQKAASKREEAQETAEAIEDVMHEVARRNDTVRFIRIYDEVHGQENYEVLPIINGYRAGQLIDTVVPIEKLENSHISPVSLETILRQHGIL